MTALAALAAGLACWLLMAPSPRLSGAATPPGGSSPAGRSTGWLVVALVSVAVVSDVLPGPAMVAALATVAVAVAGHRLLTAQRSRRRAAQTAVRGLEICEQLSGDLAAGQPPGTALDRAADDWPPLRPVAEAFRIGADVPAAWAALVATPGAEQLRYVGAAWRVAEGSGSGLGAALDRVAADLRADQTTRRVVAGELASARATARLVAGLPVLALLMGSGAGGDPWRFLLGHPVGIACLAGGLGLGLAGLWWIELIARGVDGR